MPKKYKPIAGRQTKKEGSKRSFSAKDKRNRIALTRKSRSRLCN